MVLCFWALLDLTAELGSFLRRWEIAAESETERIPADPLADCRGDGWGRRLTEQQHDVHRRSGRGQLGGYVSPSSRSAATNKLTSSSNETDGAQPSVFLALLKSPTSGIGSAGRQ